MLTRESNLTLRRVAGKSCPLDFCSAGMTARAVSSRESFVTLSTSSDRAGVQVPGVPNVVISDFMKKDKVKKGGEREKLIPAARIWERIPDHAGHVSSALQLAPFSYL